MKISKIEAIEAMRPPLKQEGKWWDIRNKYGLGDSQSHQWKNSRLMFALKVTTDSGLHGLYYGCDGARLDVQMDRLRRHWALMQNENLLNFERLLEKTLQPLVDEPMDTCLWDLKGKFAGLPVHQLVGGAGRERIKAYASSFRDVGSPEEYADQAQACLEMGYQGYKIHVYCMLDPRTMTLGKKDMGYPDYDIEVCRAVRARVGDRMDLMLDPVGFYSLEESVRVGRELEKLNFKWFEEPMNENEHPERYAELRAQVKVPILSPEHAPGSFYTRAEWLRNGWTDFVRPSNDFTDMAKCMVVAQANRTRCEAHLGGFHKLQAIAAFPETVAEYYEMLLVEPGTEFYGFGFVPGGDPAFDRGDILVPQTPGMGLCDAVWDYAVENRLRSFEISKSNPDGLMTQHVAATVSQTK